MNTGRLAAANNRQAISPTTNLELKALLFERELGEFGALHEVDDLFNLF